MGSKLNTSGVLSSGVDYFCLVCESRLHHEPGALAHIQKPVHAKKFEETDYFENKENYVRKINKWYFCELCSLLLPTAARARLHVAEPQHLGNKSTKILQRRGTTVVAFSRVQIDDKAWHGIVDDACVICNTEFYDQSIHINETNHIIKLIQSTIEFDSDKNIFRKVDDGSVQCITCNVIIGLNSIDVHFNETEHKTLYQGCCCDDEKITKKPDENAKSSETQGEKDDDCNKTSLCSKPVLKMDLNVQDMKQDILNPKDDKVSCDAEEDIDNYIKQNNMRSYCNKNEVYCIICNSNIPYSLKSLKEHVAGGGHQRKMEDKKEKKETLVKTKSKRSVGANLDKIKTATYINFFFIAKGFNADVILNDKICINMFSFLLMVNVGDKFKCLLCNEKIQKFQWKQHMALKMHDDVLDECLVVISKKHDNEFIREFQPGHFHCGYCNIQCDSWETLESHLQSPVHSDNKTSSKWRLEQAEAQIFFLKMQNRLRVAPEGFKLRMVMRDMFRYNDYRSDSDRDNESDSESD